MSLPEIPRIDIEREFANCVRKIGGEVLVDRFGPSPVFENADYAFPQDGVIAELKCLERDTRTEPTFKQRVSALHMQWIREGKVPPLPYGGGTWRVNTRNLPRECAVQIENILTKRLQRVVEKANSQIKRTKEVLGLPDAKGLLLLANDGDMIFELGGVLHSLHRVLHGKFRQISSIVYFTVNHTVTGPGIHTPARIWLPLTINDAPEPDRPSVSQEFLQKVMAGWFNREATILGMPVIAFQRGDDPPEVIERIRFGG
jgi:hypothetical protein